MKRKLAFLLSFVLLFSIFTDVSAQEDISATIKDLLEKDKSSSDTTIIIQESERTESESQSETGVNGVVQDYSKDDESFFSDEEITIRSGFQSDVMTASAGTPVYEDIRMTVLLGVISNRSTVYAVSLSGNVMRIAFACGSKVVEGYSPASSLSKMSESSKASVQQKTMRGVKVYGYRLPSIVFETASAVKSSPTAASSKPRVTSTPTPSPSVVATPTLQTTPTKAIISTPTPTLKVTASPTSNSGVATSSSSSIVSSRSPVILDQPIFLDGIDSGFIGIYVNAKNVVSYQWQYSKDNGVRWENLTSEAIWIGCKKHTLYFLSKTEYDGYLFRCKLVNRYGVTYSDELLFSLDKLPDRTPEISIQPNDVSIWAGKVVSFQITASGAEKYQWQYSLNGSLWKDLSNEDTSSSNTSKLSFTADTKYNGCLFRCIVSNAAGVVYSKGAALTVYGTSLLTPSPTPAKTKPVFVQHPQAQTAFAGEEISISASAENAISYQWQYSINNSTWVNLTNGQEYKGSNSDQVSFIATESHNGVFFRLIAVNTAGSVISNSVRIIVKAAGIASIEVQPSDIFTSSGNKVEFNVKAQNASSFQWYSKSAVSSWNKLSDNGLWSGSNTERLSFVADTSLNGYQFKCIVYGKNNSVSSKEVSLSLVVEEPTFDLNVSTHVAGAIGSFVLLESKVTGATAYEWQMKTKRGGWTSIKDGTTYIGITTPSLKIKLLSSNLHNSYRLKASNSYGFAYSPVYTIEELLAQPSNIIATAVSRNEIKVNWKASDDYRIRNYQVFYNTSNVIDYNQFVTVSGSTANIAGLEPGTNYHIWVQAMGTAISSILDDNVHVFISTLPMPEKPGAPTSISADPSSTSVIVTWQKPVNSEINGYNVFYRVYSSSYSQKITVSGENTCSALLTGLSKKTNYQIWVRAFNDAGDGISSASIVVKTLAYSTAPKQPVNITASSNTSNSVKVNWDGSPSDDVAGYYIYFGTSDDVNAAKKLDLAYAKNATSATITGLKEKTTYYFWVTAFNEDRVESVLNNLVRTSAAPKAYSTGSSSMINAEAFSKTGDRYIGTPYSTYDCQAFVEKMLSDAGLNYNLAGSNAWYRQMSWRGTPEQCIAKFGCIPTGAFLFIVKHDGGEPSHYNDSLGNASHIGVVTHRNGGAIHSSYSRGGVYTSVFNDATIPNGGWNMIGLWTRMDYGEAVNSILEGR